MQTVGIRELKEQASDVLRRVREDGEVIDITYYGKVVAQIVPVRKPPKQEELEKLWANIEELAAEVSEAWIGDMTALEAVKEGRREL